MRRNPQVVAGWSADLTPVMDAALICGATTCRTNVAWRPGPTEIQVFAIYPMGEAVPVSDRPAYTFR